MAIMKPIFAGIAFIILLVLIFGTEADKSQFSGYAQHVKPGGVKKTEKSERAHDLDLSKYRPSFQPESN